jgi:hypothetical protein
VGEVGESLAKLRVALTAPALVGVKVTLNGRLWPAVIVTGKVKSLTLNAELLALADVMVTLAPVAVKVPEPDPLVPTTTLPSARVVGETPNWPAVVVPVPESGMLSDGFEASEVTVTVPLALVADVGLNTTWKLVFWPDASVMGVVTPLRLNPVLAAI